MKKVLVFFLLTITLSIFNFDYTKATDKKTKVAAIGSSSFAQGCASGGFIQELQKTLINTHIFYCKDTSKSGQGYTYFLNSWRNYVQGKGYNELLLYAGLNGLSNAQGLNTYKNNLDTIISEAKNEKIKVIIVGAQPFKGYGTYDVTTWQKWDDNIRLNNARLKIDPRIDNYIDVYSVVDKNNDKAIDNGLSLDHLHLNTPTGKKVVYNLLMQQVYSGAGGTTEPAKEPTKELTDREIAELIKKPTPKINIPGLTFSDINAENLITTDEFGNKWLSIPYLGEYIAAVYKYGIVVISLIAVFSIIIAGVMLTGSGGNSDIVNKAKKRIVLSVISIIISTTSYTLLYIINPELVNFRDLKILYVKGEELEGVVFLSDKDYSKLTGLPKLKPSEYINMAVKAAQEVNIDPCIATAIVNMESRGNPGAIGHDEDIPDTSARKDFLISGEKYSKATFTKPFTDKKDYNLKSDQKKIGNYNVKNDDAYDKEVIKIDSPPNYGINFERFSHGIGLCQIQSYKNQCGSLPGRKAGTKCYTVLELFTPEKNIEAMLYIVKSYAETASQYGFSSGENKLMATFRAYNAGPGNLYKYKDGPLYTSSELAKIKYVEKAMKYYAACKAQ